MSEKIPRNWEVTFLGNLGEFSKGRGISKNDTSSRGIPCIRYAEIYTDYDYVIKRFRSFISKDKVSTTKRLEKNDIVFAGSGETVADIGKSVSFVHECEAYVGGDTIIFSPIDGVDSTFLSYQLNDDIRRIQLRKLGQGSSIIHIYSSGLKHLRVYLPPFDEQQEIAPIITSVDEVIENTQKQIDKLQNLKKATMNELLTKGIGHTEFKDSELGEIPKGWKCRELGDLADRIEGGGTPSRTVPEYWEGDIPWSTVKDLMGTYLSSTEETITELGLKQSSSRLIPSGTIILATRMAVGKAVVFNTNVAINQDLKAFFHKSIVDPNFLLQLFLSKSSYLETLATGSTVKGIRLKELRAIPVKIPPLPEQKKIASILSSIDKNIEEKQHKLNKTQSLKKSLMQDLLTGKVRVQVN